MQWKAERGGESVASARPGSYNMIGSRKLLNNPQLHRNCDNSAPR